MKRTVRFGLGPAGIVLILALARCGRSTAPEPAAGPRRSPASAATTPSGPVLVTLSQEAIRQAGIATEVVHPAPFAVTLSLPARLSPVPEAPEEVEARLAYQAAEAQFRRASQERERVQKLAAENVLASKAVQAAEAEFAQARVERLRAETTLRSLGIDASREGSFPVADFWALADVYESQAPLIKAGAVAWIRVDSLPGEAFPSRVASLARFVKPQTRTLTARIAIQDAKHRLRPQGLATAEIQVEERIALSVPTSGIIYESTDRILFVRRAGGFEKVRVRVGAERAGRAEILEGISDGDEVVTRGAQILLGEMFKTQIPAGEEKDEEAEEN